jgi:plasmid stabilization system protein ParE
MSRRSGRNFLLTRRAVRDIKEILADSTERWGRQTAETYLDALQAGLDRLGENSGLLWPEPDFHESFMFYRVQQHLFVCDARPASLVVLAVVHSARDIPSRLAELQPSLITEVEMLHRKLESKRQGKQP